MLKLTSDKDEALRGLSTTAELLVQSCGYSKYPNRRYGGVRACSMVTVCVAVPNIGDKERYNCNSSHTPEKDIATCSQVNIIYNIHNIYNSHW